MEHGPVKRPRRFPPDAALPPFQKGSIQKLCQSLSPGFFSVIPGVKLPECVACLPFGALSKPLRQVGQPVFLRPDLLTERGVQLLIHCHQLRKQPLDPRHHVGGSHRLSLRVRPGVGSDRAVGLVWSDAGTGRIARKAVLLLPRCQDDALPLQNLPFFGDNRPPPRLGRGRSPR